jgi:drug/metabolite transporter (DMT)-like permease
LMDLNFFVVITLISWGIWGIADKKALLFAGKEDVLLRLYLTSWIWIPIAFLALNQNQPGWQINAEVLLWTGMAGCACVIALLAYVSAMSMAEASLVLGITAAYPLVMQFCASLFLHEKLIVERLLGALIIGGGLFLISGSAGKAQASRCQGTDLNARIIIYIVIATLTWGVTGLFDKKAVSCSSPLIVFFCKRLWDVPLFFLLLLMYKMRHQKLDWKEKMSWLWCAGSSCALGVGGYSYVAALSMASASYVITITGCYPLLMYLFALWLLKEQFNKLRCAGIALVVAGGLLVHLTSAS